MTPREERLDAEANAFAMELLMPEAMVRERVQGRITEQRIGELANEFQVTHIVMTVRLLDLGLIRRRRR